MHGMLLIACLWHGASAQQASYCGSVVGCFIPPRNQPPFCEEHSHFYRALVKPIGRAEDLVIQMELGEENDSIAYIVWEFELVEMIEGFLPPRFRLPIKEIAESFDFSKIVLLKAEVYSNFLCAELLDPALTNISFSNELKEALQADGFDFQLVKVLSIWPDTVRFDLSALPLIFENPNRDVGKLPVYYGVNYTIRLQSDSGVLIAHTNSLFNRSILAMESPTDSMSTHSRLVCNYTFSEPKPAIEAGSTYLMGFVYRKEKRWICTSFLLKKGYHSHNWFKAYAELR